MRSVEDSQIQKRGFAVLDLIADIVRTIIDGAQAAEKAESDQTAREHELTALRLAARRIETEIAKRTLPP